MRSDRFKHPGVSNFNVSAGSPKTKLCPSIAGNPHHSLFVLGLPGYIYIYIVPKIESIHDLSTLLHQRLGSAYVKLEKRVTAGWRPRWDSFLRHVALVYLSKLDVDGGPPFHPLLKLRHPGVVCRCLVVQIVIGLPQWESSIPTIHCLELC